MRAHKLFAVLLSTLLLMACLPLTAISVSAAQSGTSGECRWTLDDNGHLTIFGRGKMGNYEHVNNGNGELVLNRPWGQNVTSVTIMDGVTTIGERAFHYCKPLKWITIPNSVQTIGYGAFLGCDSLVSITVDEHNDNFCSVDGVLFNKDKTTLIRYPAANNATYTIPNSVKTVDAYAFYGCESIRSVTMPDSITTIGEYAFSYCNNMTDIAISNNVISIERFTFNGCTALQAVTIPDSVKTIRSWAFSECRALSSVSIGNGIETIEGYAFSLCEAITDVYYDNEQNRHTIEMNKAGNEDLLGAQWHYKYVSATTLSPTTTTSVTCEPTVFTTTTIIKNTSVPQSDNDPLNSTMAVIGILVLLSVITMIVLFAIRIKKKKSK